MKTVNSLKYLPLAMSLTTLAACGSGLQLAHPTAANPGGSAITASSSDANQPAANGNTTAVDANGTPALNGNGTQALLKCVQFEVNGGQIVNCSCSTDGGHTCPTYNGGANDANATGNANGPAAATDPNAPDPNSLAAGTYGSHTFSCSTTAVAGGYIYDCDCGEVRNQGDTSPGCPSFYNPQNANAVAPTGSPKLTCKTEDNLPVGTTTTCACADSVQTGPCPFYEGNSYTDSANPYQETCTSTLTATGVTTTCNCDASKQANGAKCPSTFDPTYNVSSPIE